MGELVTFQSKAYGRWEAFLLVDGQEFEGSGLSELQAVERARMRARAGTEPVEPDQCAECGAPVRQAEANLSRRACKRVLCSDCRGRLFPATWGI